MQKAHFLCNFSICVQNSSNEDSDLRKPTVPKDTHYPQERTFPWHTSTTCKECAPIRLVRFRPSHIIHKLWSFHEPLVHQPECALLCLGQCIVPLSVSHAVLYFHLNTHQESKKHTPKNTVSVLFKGLCTLDLTSRRVADRSVCPNSCIIHKKTKFS